MKDLTIDFGYATDPIPRQIEAQGLRIRKGAEIRVDAIEYFRRSLAGMKVHGLITESEYSRIVKRALKKLSTFTEEKE